MRLLSPQRAATIALMTILGACAAPASTGSEEVAASLPAAYASGRAYEPAIDPAAFVERVDNRFFPLDPGTAWTLEGGGEADGETTTTEVTTETRTVMGVVCTVVHDEVAIDGEPVEITSDWYAQDVHGNVWYFGEETAEYEGGEVVSTAGSWEAGVDGAMPGIIMPAEPDVGVTYRQEFYAGEAEDLAKAVELDVTSEVPFGAYDGVLVTEDWTPLEPDVVERKFYAPGVGLIMEETIEGGESTFKLVAFQQP
jgi:hypothetical protein